MDRILYQIVKIILNISLKNGEKTDNPSIRIYVSKTENRITFKIKTMKLLGSNKNKITKDENGKNVPHLEITEVVLVHCNIVNNDYQQDSRVLYTFVPTKSFGNYLIFYPKISYS